MMTGLLNSDTLDLQEIRRALSRTAPQTVRRVLPREVVQEHIHRHLNEMETIMKSFQAILTFPTEGRALPEKTRRLIGQQLTADLNKSADKIDGEVKHLLDSAQQLQVLQSHIMLHVLAEQPFPFCLLNTYDYRVNSHDTVPCYVILWAQHNGPDQPLSVWAQLSARIPLKPGWLPVNEVRTPMQTVRMPTGQADFYAFNTAISVVLYDVPTSTEALLSGKSIKDLFSELRTLRDTLVRRKEQRGKFLHLIWTTHQKDPSQVNISEFDFYGGGHSEPPRKAHGEQA